MLKPVIGIMTACALLVPVLAAPVMAADFPVPPDDPVVTDALDYFDSIQGADGNIGGYNASAWAAMAISAAGEDPGGFGDPSVIDYLKDNASQQSLELNPVTGIARVVLAAVAACEDPSAFGPGDPTYVPDGDYVAQLKSFFDEDEGQFVYEGCLEYDPVTWECILEGTVTDTINDDIWALMALVATGEPLDSDMVTTTASFIEANQGFDGGWSYATIDSPNNWGNDCDDTAAALMALSAVGGPSDPGITDLAVGFMQSCQGPNGGFQYDAWSTESLASTVWAIDAIVAIGQDPTGAGWSAAGSPVDFLMTYRQADGSFLDSAAWSPNPYKDTADAIISLTGNFYPIVPECPEFVFEDPDRGTKLCIIDSDADTFRFTAPDGYDSGVVEADIMIVTGRAITIIHSDRGIMVAARANIKRDWCLGSLLDKRGRELYVIKDPNGVE